MKKRFTNFSHVEGFIFSHTLTNRVSKAGVPFINGKISVATDEAGTNVIDVNFSYVTEYFGKTDKVNQSYQVLQNIIDNAKTFEEVGTEATKVRSDGFVETNDFVTREGEMASPKRVAGSFVHILTGQISANPATFDVDMVISSVVEREQEEMPNYLELRGYAFDFRGTAIPLSLNVRTQAAIDYFLGADISQNNPLCSEIKGEIISTVIETSYEEEGAFGEPIIHTTQRNLRTWDVNFASKEPYEWDDESFITKKELKESLAAREEYLAGVKKRHDEWVANRDGGQSFAAPAPKKAAVVDDDDDMDDFAF